MKFTSLLPFLAALAAVATALTASSNAYPLPEPCEGPACANPPGTLEYQDFSVIRRASDGQYFRYAKSNSTGHGLSVATAPALRGPWNYQFEVLEQLPGSYLSNRTDTDVWAPDIKYVNNTYYLFYSIHSNDYSVPPQTFDLCVATSPTMEPDSWTDHGPMGVPGVSDPTEYVRLDGNLIANASDPSGIALPYMAFGSYNWGLYGVAISSDYLKVAVEDAQPTLLVADQQNPGAYAGNKTEGAFQLENDGFIYLFYIVSSARLETMDGACIERDGLTVWCTDRQLLPCSGPRSDRLGVSRRGLSDADRDTAGSVRGPEW